MNENQAYWCPKLFDLCKQKFQLTIIINTTARYGCSLFENVIR